MNESIKFMGTRLNPGITKGNVRTYYFSCFMVILLAVSANVLQPYILTTFLNMRVSEHGTATGNIALFNEIVLLIFVGLWGVTSDRVGRRIVYAIGFLIMGLGFCMTPLAQTLVMLIGFRGIYQVGIAATSAMLATVVADYVVNEDRGKGNAIMGIFNGLGAALGAMMIGKLPQIYAARGGQDGITAGWSSYLTVVVLCVVCAIVMRLGLKGGVQEGTSRRIPFGKMFKEGITAAKNDTGVALAYCAAFVTRADLVIAGLYFPLWLSKHHQSLLETGAPIEKIDAACAEGIAAGGILIGIVGGGGLLFAPVIGILADRINRVTALMIGLFMNVVGYGLIFFVVDPSGSFLKIAAVVVGFGQVGGTITAAVLIQQQANPKLRGSIIGFFNVCGAFGIMVTCWLGGILFDAISEQSLFVMIAAANLVVFILAIIMKSKVHKPAFADTAGAGGAIH